MGWITFRINIHYIDLFQITEDRRNTLRLGTYYSQIHTQIGVLFLRLIEKYAHTPLLDKHGER